VALYTTFGELQTMVRAESRMSTNPAVGSGATDRHKVIINRVYEMLFDSHDWSHLRYVAPRVALSAGSRYANVPAALDYNKMEKLVAWQGSVPYPLDPGIGPDEYAAFDSDADERSDPPFRYDLRATSVGAVQIEIWPIPASNDFELEVIGRRKWSKLVNSVDICMIDDRLVALYAAESVLRPINSDDADGKLAAARQRLIDLRAAGVLPQTAGSTMARVGLGGISVAADRGRASVRVSRG
jgi:hypothetical protein